MSSAASRDDAVSELTQAGLKPNPVGVNSLEPVDTVLATGPSAGTEVLEGTAVRVNYSKGPKPISVPNVVGCRSRARNRPCQGAGFAVSRNDVDDATQPEGVVVGQNPAAGTQQGKGSVITVQVSKGPQSSQVPDVTSLSAADAPHSWRSRASTCRRSRRSSTPRISTVACCRRTPKAAPTPSRARPS